MLRFEFARILLAKPVPTFAEYAQPSGMNGLTGNMTPRDGGGKRLPHGLAAWSHAKHGGAAPTRRN